MSALIAFWEEWGEHTQVLLSEESHIPNMKTSMVFPKSLSLRDPKPCCSPLG